MSYVRQSTENPLGHKPWNAMLQPGGLGAFFPNAEAVGHPSLIVDRDSANCGWKCTGGGNKIAPRAYYPPNYRKQYSTNKSQGLGAVAQPVSSAVLPRVCPAWGCGPAPVIRFVGTGGGSYVPAQTAPTTSNTNNGGTSYGAPSIPTSVSPVIANNATAGTPVPATWPVTSPYTDTGGNTWQFNGQRWVIVSVSQTVNGATTGMPASAVMSSPPPAGTSTTSPYTDPYGNVWTYANGQWAISSAAGGGITSWLAQSTIISALPNWSVLLGGGAAAWLLLSMMGKKR